MSNDEQLSLYGVPVIFDPEMEQGRYALVDKATGKVLAEGQVPAGAGVAVPGLQAAAGPQAGSQGQAGPAPGPEPPEGRTRTLAGVLAGYRWPGCGGLDRLRKGQQAAAVRAARAALDVLNAEPD